MSSTLALSGPPFAVNLGTMAIKDFDKAFGLDCTANLQARGDTIIAVGTPTIQRDDGQPLFPTDLSISNILLIIGGLQFGWTTSAGNRPGNYYITFPLTLASGSSIERTVLIRVLLVIG